MQEAISMSKVALSDDLNNYNSKALIRAKVKELFSEFSAKIFELVDESSSIDSKKFEALSGYSSNFYSEYCSQLKAIFESPSALGKRSIKHLYLSYNGKHYVLTQQGLTEKAPITISTYLDAIPLKESVHDVEKACLKLRFQQ